MPSLIRAISKNPVRLHDGFGAVIPASDLLARAGVLSKELIREGILCAGLRLGNGIDWLCADLACLLARVTLVPIPRFFTPSQVDHIRRSTHMDALLGSIDGVEETFEAFRPYGTEFSWFVGPDRNCQIPEEIAKVTFTSGTTGTPKGVYLTLAQQERVAAALAQRTANLGLTRHLAVLPMSILLQNVAGVYGALMGGVDVVLPPSSWVGIRGSSSFEPAVLLEAIRKYQPDNLILFPQMLKRLVETIGQGSECVRGLKFVSVGGARTAPDLINRARELGLPVYEGYGLSEACSVVTLNVPGEDKPGSVGRVLFSDTLRLAENNEIQVYLPHGVHYLGEPQQSAGWYPTGDRGSLDEDGYVQVLGRLKLVLVTSFGRNVSPEWVESELLAETAIAQACVLGDDQPALCALVVPTADSGSNEIRRSIERCNTRLPDYARIKNWRVIPPMTPENGLLTTNGRIRRGAVQTTHADDISALFRAQNTQPQEILMNFYQELIRDTETDSRVLLEQPVITECLSGKITLSTYRAFLEQAYHHVKHTVPLLMACGGRMPERLEWLREAIAEYIDEELGHQEWILCDIAACGGDAEKVRNGKPSISTDIMVAYAWDCVLRRNPVSFFGMVFVLEGTSVKLASEAADIIQQQLGLPDAAFSYLRSHGAIDLEHIGFFESLVNRLDRSEDRDAVRDTARVMYRLYAQVFASLPRARDRREAA